MIKKLLKFFLIAIILLFVMALSVFLALFLRISLFFSPVIFIVILSLYFLLFFAIKKTASYLRKRKSQTRDDDALNYQQFHENFNNALIHTKKYFREYKKKMPWYMMFGLNQEGKSNLVSGSNIYTLSNQRALDSNILAKDHAHFWALDNMVVAETNGEIFTDKPSKKAFSLLKETVEKLRAYRRFIQLKGFVVTLSVDQLYGQKEKLINYALKLRREIEVISRKYARRYPIYLIITKADKIQGFTSFALSLPEEILQQAFGHLFNEKEFYADHKMQVKLFAEKINERIRGFNTLQLQANSSLLPRVLLLEDQITQLKKPLGVFLNTFFKIKAQIKEDNPILRGIFLTSSKQFSTPLELDKDTILEGIELPNRNLLGKKNLFSYDLFHSVLVNDFDLTQAYFKKAQLTKRYYQRLLVIWWAGLLGGTAYLGVAYAHAVEAFMEIQQIAKVRNDQFGDNLNYNLLLMSKMNQDINRVIELKDRWFLSIWPYASMFDQIIDGYQEYYVKKFNQHVTESLNQTLEKSVNLVKKPKFEHNFGYVVENIVQGVNLIQARLDLMSYDEISQLNMEGLIINDDFKPNSYGILYKNYVAWNNHLNALKRMRGQLLNLLDRLNVFSQPYTWLIDWVNQVSNIRPILAGNYWPENNFNHQIEPSIMPAYTQSGMEQIKALLHNMANVSLKPTEVEQFSLNFFAKYDLNRYRQWEQFSNDFREDIEMIPSQAAWYSLAQLDLINSPYSLYSNDVAFNYTDSMLINQPEWLKLFLSLRHYFKRSAYSIYASKASESFWTKLTSYADKYSNDFDSRVNSITYDQNLFQAVKNYQNELLNLQKYVLKLDEASSFNTVKSLFVSSDNQNPKTNLQELNKNQFYNTYNKFQQIKFFATTDLGLLNKNQAAWNVYRGMFDLLFHGTMENAMCYTEQMWNDNILNQYASTLSDSHLSLDDLFGEKSIVGQFMRQYVYPFVRYSQSRSQFEAKHVFGHNIKFSPFVYEYIKDQHIYSQLKILENQIKMTMKQAQAIIPLEIKPTNVNQDAKLLPISTSITVMCGDKSETFTNFDMISSFSLTNNIFSCTSASVNINFKGLTNFTVTKFYQGEDGLLELIRDFTQTGSMTFRSVDFPKSYSKLEDYNIKNLTVFIDFQGVQSIKSLLNEYTKKKAELVQIVYNKLADWQYLDVVSCWNDQSWKVTKNPNNKIQKIKQSKWI